jgi:hypothetical protein
MLEGSACFEKQEQNNSESEGRNGPNGKPFSP